MIPYLALTTFSIGPLTLHAWGLLVALGFLFGAFIAARLAKQRGDDASIIWDMLTWVAIAGMVGGRLGHVLFYDPEYYGAHFAEIFEIWKGGLSIYGGFILASITGIFYLRYRKVDLLRYADIVAFGMPFGMWIGRIGCFLIHDHPGTATHFLLGVQYPDGVIRHDLGLYESINAFVLAMLFLWLSRRQRPIGMYLAVFSIWYGATRFGMDFLRVVDIRYFGFTPGQYFSIVLFGIGIFFIMWIKRGAKKDES